MLKDALKDDSGSATIEYALTIVIAAAAAGLLYAVVTGDMVENAITGIIQRALSVLG